MATYISDKGNILIFSPTIEQSYSIKERITQTFADLYDQTIRKHPNTLVKIKILECPLDSKNNSDVDVFKRRISEL